MKRPSVNAFFRFGVVCGRIWERIDRRADTMNAGNTISSVMNNVENLQLLNDIRGILSEQERSMLDSYLIGSIASDCTPSEWRMHVKLALEKVLFENRSVKR